MISQPPLPSVASSSPNQRPQFRYIFGLCATLMMLAGCSGSGSEPAAVDNSDNTDGQSSPNNSEQNISEENNSSSETPLDGDGDGDQLEGVFLDAAVAGLNYRTESLQGVTDTAGRFRYRAGEIVQFSIGDIQLPEVDAAPTITPLDLFDTNDVLDTRVSNLNRLLQTLDSDANPENGLTISESATASATGLTVDFAARSFDNQVINLVANSGGGHDRLRTVVEANRHFLQTLGNNNLVSSGCEKTHPAVGRVATFTGLFHEVAGSLTVVDDCTLEITGFTYDGLGPDVYFYTGINQTYLIGDQFIIGPRLNGNRWQDETIRLTIPEGMSLDSFDSLSVWCFDVRVSFGDVYFGT